MSQWSERITQEGNYILSRKGRDRFDLSVSTVFTDCRRDRLAHQIRQDLWRKLQTTRGFSPIVEVEKYGGIIKVRVGGQCDGTFPKSKLEAEIDSLLNSPAHRCRWLNYARRHKHA